MRIRCLRILTLCPCTRFATEESIEQRHIHDSNSTCVTQPAVLKWDQARALDERLRNLFLPRRGNMLRTERFMVGIHPGNIRSGYCDTTYSTPNYPEGEREQCLVVTHKQGLMATQADQKIVKNTLTLHIKNKKKHK